MRKDESAEARRARAELACSGLESEAGAAEVIQVGGALLRRGEPRVIDDASIPTVPRRV